MRETVTEAATVEEAIVQGIQELGLPKNEVSYEVLAEPGKGFLGLTSKRVARVRLWATADGQPEVESAPAPVPEPEPEPTEVLEAEPAPEEVPSSVQEVSEEPLTDEELDQIADAAVDTVKEILKGFDIEATIDEYEGDQGRSSSMSSAASSRS